MSGVLTDYDQLKVRKKLCLHLQTTLQKHAPASKSDGVQNEGDINSKPE